MTNSTPATNPCRQAYIDHSGAVTNARCSTLHMRVCVFGVCVWCVCVVVAVVVVVVCVWGGPLYQGSG